MDALNPNLDAVRIIDMPLDALKPLTARQLAYQRADELSRERIHANLELDSYIEPAKPGTSLDRLPFAVSMCGTTFNRSFTVFALMTYLIQRDLRSIEEILNRTPPPPPSRHRTPTIEEYFSCLARETIAYLVANDVIKRGPPIDTQELLQTRRELAKELAELKEKQLACLGDPALRDAYTISMRLKENVDHQLAEKIDAEQTKGDRPDIPLYALGELYHVEAKHVDFLHTLCEYLYHSNSSASRIMDHQKRALGSLTQRLEDYFWVNGLLEKTLFIEDEPESVIPWHKEGFSYYRFSEKAVPLIMSCIIPKTS